MPCSLWLAIQNCISLCCVLFSNALYLRFTFMFNSCPFISWAFFQKRRTRRGRNHSVCGHRRRKPTLVRERFTCIIDANVVALTFSDQCFSVQCCIVLLHVELSRPSKTCFYDLFKTNNEVWGLMGFPGSPWMRMTFFIFFRKSMFWVLG